MKKRSTKLIFGLFALVVCLAVGFATVSSVTPTATGSAAMKDSNLNVVFDGTPVCSDTTNDSASIDSTDKLKATFSVTNLAAVGDTRTVTYTVKNNEVDLAAKIYVATAATDITNTKSDYFEVTTDCTGSSNAKTIAKNGATTTVVITVKLIKVPTASADSSSTITVKFTADPTQPTD